MKNMPLLIQNLRIAVISVFTGTAAFLIFLSLGAAVSLAVDFSDLIRSLSVSAAAVSGFFISGAVSAFFYRKHGIAAGAAGGLRLLMFLLIICALIGNEITVCGIAETAAEAAAAGTAGGIYGVNIKMNDKKYRIINRLL